MADAEHQLRHDLQFLNAVDALLDIAEKREDRVEFLTAVIARLQHERNELMKGKPE